MPPGWCQGQGRRARLGHEIGAYTVGMIVCRPTREEAEDFYRYATEEAADWAADRPHPGHEGPGPAPAGGGGALPQEYARGNGGLPCIGDPDEVAGTWLASATPASTAAACPSSLRGRISVLPPGGPAQAGETRAAKTASLKLVRPRSIAFLAKVWTNRGLRPRVFMSGWTWDSAATISESFRAWRDVLCHELALPRVRLLQLGRIRDFEEALQQALGFVLVLLEIGFALEQAVQRFLDLIRVGLDEASGKDERRGRREQTLLCAHVVQGMDRGRFSSWWAKSGWRAPASAFFDWMAATMAP